MFKRLKCWLGWHSDPLLLHEWTPSGRPVARIVCRACKATLGKFS